MRSKITTFLSKLPVETYVILLTGSLIFVSVFTIDTITHRWGLDIDPRNLLKGPLFGSGLLRQSSVALTIYGGLLLIKYLLSKNEAGYRGIKRALSDPDFFKIAKSVLFWFLVSSAFVFGTSAMLNVLFRSFSYEHMGKASEQLMHWDKILFGIHPSFYLHTLAIPLWLQLGFVYAYAYLPVLLATLLAILFCTYERLFRIVFLSLALSAFFSMPFWIAYPGIPPHEMYQLNVFKHAQFTEVSSIELNDMKIQPRIKATMDVIELMWIDQEGKSFGVSSFPSTHIIWATIIFYAMFQIRWWLGLLFFPYYALNFVATMFLLEHYAVDTLLGVIISIAAIFCAHKLLNSEKKYFKDDYGLLSIFKTMNIREQTRKLLFK